MKLRLSLIQMVERHLSKKSKKALVETVAQEQGALYVKNNLLFISLNVKPNSKQDMVVALDSDSVSIAIAAEARDGEANQAVVEFIAEILKVKKYQVNLVRGHKSHSKLVSIDDPTLLDL